MTKWLIKSNGPGGSSVCKLSELKSAVAEEVRSKVYNEIFCDNGKISFLMLIVQRPYF